MKLRINSLYVCVKNMNRAIRFYEKFFEQPVSIRDDVFSIFIVHGFRYCLFNNQAVNDPVTWGDNCLPSIEVDDIHEAYNKVKELGCPIVFELTRIGDNMVFKFTDSEGNDIEVYAKASGG